MLDQQYEDALSYLFSQLPMYQREGKTAFKPGLDRILAILDVMGNPHKDLSCIHVAGTNGKGSVSHMLAAVFYASGKKVGLYTSPHLTDFRERVKINGNKIEKQTVVDFIDKYRPLLEDIQPSFFEWTVALAFYSFKNENVDIAVIECGLGGRLDSTNVIDPLLSVITNISLDHTAILGNTIGEIAFEKGGIIKKNRPVVIGKYQDESHPVFEEKAKQMQADLYYARDICSLQRTELDFHQQIFTLTYLQGDEKEYQVSIDSVAEYQQENLRTAIAALSTLGDHHDSFKLSVKSIQAGLRDFAEQMGFHGRFEVVGRHPTVILDGAHNQAGLEGLFGQLDRMMSDNSELHIVYAMVKDKDINTLWSYFPITAQYYICQAQIPRAKNAVVLASEFEENGFNASTIDSSKQAIQTALENAEANDVVVVCGSLYLVAEALEVLS